MTVSLGRRSLLTLILALAVACGEIEAVVLAETGSPSTTELLSLADSKSSVDDAGVTLPAPSGSTDQEQVTRKFVGSPLLRLSIDVPAYAVDDSLGDPIMPDWAIGHNQWFIDGCCRIIVVMQSQRSPFDVDAHVVSLDAAGLTWDLYDRGPRDGTTLSATATDGDVSFVISIQELFPDRVSDQSPLHILSTAIRSITIEPL